MIDPTSNRRNRVNDVLRQRASASAGPKDSQQDSRVRHLGGRRRQVQMGEVLKPQQHA